MELNIQQEGCPCSIFPEDSRLREICEGKSGLSEDRVKKILQAYGLTAEWRTAFCSSGEEPKEATKRSATVVLGAPVAHKKKAACQTCGKRPKKQNQIISKPKLVMPLPSTKKRTIGVPIEKDKATLHIIYHIMPLAGEHEPVWRRHVDWLREVRLLFNGRMVIGVVTKNRQDKADYIPIEEVKKAFDGIDCEFFVTENPLPNPGSTRGAGEGGTFWNMLSMLETQDKNTVIFYGHSKGVTKPAEDFTGPSHRWASAMFDVIFRNPHKAIESLDSYAFCGVFRRMDRRGYFSGTFFAMRAVDVFSSEWLSNDRKYGCVEFWPGSIFDIRRECDCLFGDGTEKLNDPSAWPGIEKRLDHWKTKGAVREDSTHGVSPKKQSATLSDCFFRKQQCLSCGYFSSGICGISKEEIVDDSGHPSVHLGLSESSCPAWKWQSQNGNTGIHPVATKRSMLFHIYARKSAEWNWKWHIEQIKKNASLFNGKICIGIATGDGLVSPDDIQKSLSDVQVSDWIIKQNTKTMAETSTFNDLLGCLDANEKNQVVFRGHTKGATHARGSIEQRWAEMMWETCMDLRSVDDAIKGHVFAGPLKCHRPLVGGDVDGFFYAGSFYWFRSHDVFSRDWLRVSSERWWAEHWPGHVCKNKEAACLCHDYTESSVLGAKYWIESVAPSWEKWRKSRLRN